MSDQLEEEVIRLRIANTLRPAISQAVYDGVREAFPTIPPLDAYDKSQVIVRNIPIQTHQ
jgi:hypothetical protein